MSERRLIQYHIVRAKPCSSPETRPALHSLYRYLLATGPCYVGVCRYSLRGVGCAVRQPDGKALELRKTSCGRGYPFHVLNGDVKGVPLSRRERDRLFVTHTQVAEVTRLGPAFESHGASAGLGAHRSAHAVLTRPAALGERKTRAADVGAEFAVGHNPRTQLGGAKR